MQGDVVGVSSATTSVDGEYVNADTGSTSARLVKDDIIMKVIEPFYFFAMRYNFLVT